MRSIWHTGELILRSPYFSLTFLLVQKVTFQAVLAHFQQILEEFLWTSWHRILQVIYCFPLCFCGQFDLLERNFCTRYPLEEFLYSLSFSFNFFSVRKLTLLVVLAHFQHILEIFFWIKCHINLTVIYPYSLRFCGQFDLLEGKFWGRHPFLWLFSWFEKWHFRQFWHIPSTYWRIFFWMS